jgi:hypothetical protein
VKLTAVTVILCCSISSQAGSDTLNDSYTLGRLPTEIISDYITDWANFGDHNLLLTTFHNQFGKNGQASMGCTPLLAGTSFSDNVSILGLIPEMDEVLAPVPSSRLRISFMPLNLTEVWTSSGSASGVNLPVTTVNLFQWSYLSHQGAVTISPNQYDLTFVLGPQLNAGQFRNDLFLEHTINFDTIPFRIVDITDFPRIGITNEFEAGLAIHYSYHDSVIETEYTSSNGSDYDKEYGKQTTESTYVSLSLN